MALWMAGNGHMAGASVARQTGADGASSSSSSSDSSTGGGGGGGGASGVTRTHPSRRLPGRSGVGPMRTPPPTMPPIWSNYTAVGFIIGILLLLDVTGAKEYCHHETFTAQCEDNQVILMTEALYGRMNLGRCLTTDFGYIGCYVNVTSQTHARCSGLQACTISVPDPEFDQLNFDPSFEGSCNMDLKMYLEASYACFNVVQPELESCNKDESYNITDQHGYIASIMTQTSSCGSQASPWSVIALPGQKIRLTLLDFASVPYNIQSSEPSVPTGLVCVEQTLPLAVVNDSNIQHALSSCSENDRPAPSYTSLDHVISIYLPVATSKPRERENHFLVKYEVLGCADFEVPNFTWVQRDGDKATVGCETTETTWLMTCVGRAWQGSFGNCSKGEVNEARKDEEMSLSIATSVIIILVVSGLVGVLVLIVGLVCMKRYRRNRELLQNDIPMKDVRPLRPDQNYESGLLYAQNAAFPTSRKTGAVVSTGKGRPPGPNEYEYVWDVTVPETGSEMKGLLRTNDRRLLQTLERPPGGGGSGCHCPEIHVHVHQNTEGGPTLTTLSRIQVQAKAEPVPVVQTPTSPCQIHRTSPRLTSGASTLRPSPGTRRSGGGGGGGGGGRGNSREVASHLATMARRRERAPQDGALHQSPGFSGNENTTKRYLSHPMGKKAPRVNREDNA